MPSLPVLFLVPHLFPALKNAVYWLGEHPEIASFSFEITTLQKKDGSDLVRRIYKGLPEGPYKRGYKSPNDIENLRVVRMYRWHFPQTKLFVGIRHPVYWVSNIYYR
jgi:hypothetical protein